MDEEKRNQMPRLENSRQPPELALLWLNLCV